MGSLSFCEIEVCDDDCVYIICSKNCADVSMCTIQKGRRRNAKSEIDAMSTSSLIPDSACCHGVSLLDAACGRRSRCHGLNVASSRPSGTTDALRRLFACALNKFRRGAFVVDCSSLWCRGTGRSGLLGCMLAAVGWHCCFPLRIGRFGFRRRTTVGFRLALWSLCVPGDWFRRVHRSHESRLGLGGFESRDSDCW